MKGPKVVIIGAGSIFFGRKAIWQMVHSEHLCHGTLALVDSDESNLSRMAELARMVIEHNKSPLKLEVSSSWKEVLKDADFVVLSFAYKNAFFRGVDCQISEKYGIRMCSGDTIGPGGILRAMRELPVILEIARDIEKLAADAWIVNYINPTAVHGIALKRFFPNLKSMALCDAQFGLRAKFAEWSGLINTPEELTEEMNKALVCNTAGPNHFTWLLKAEYQGEDLIPKIVETVRQKAQEEVDKNETDPAYVGSKGFMNLKIQTQLFDAFGFLPTVVGHTKEYVRFWQGKNVANEAVEPLHLFSVPQRLEWTERVWDRVDAYLDKTVSISEFDSEFGPDPATTIIESMWANLGKSFYINTINDGAISNMSDDAFLEMYCDVDMDGVRPYPMCEMPRGLRGLMEQVLDTHELTAEAIFSEDKSILRRALLTDPLTQSIADSDAILEELLEAEKEALPGFWQS